MVLYRVSPCHTFEDEKNSQGIIHKQRGLIREGGKSLAEGMFLYHVVYKRSPSEKLNLSKFLLWLQLDSTNNFFFFLTMHNLFIQRQTLIRVFLYHRNMTCDMKARLQRPSDESE